MPRDDEYYNRYDDLCNEVARAFCAVHILNCLSGVEDVSFNSKDCRYNIINYLCHMAKQDLCLTVWKLYYDQSNKANTVKSLKKYISRLGIQKDVNVKLSPEANTIKASLDAMRKRSIAHLDKSRESITVNMVITKKAFFEIVEMVKGLYDPSIDDRVEEISDISISILEFKTHIGLRSIIDDFRMDNKKENEHAGQ